MFNSKQSVHGIHSEGMRLYAGCYNDLLCLLIGQYFLDDMSITDWLSLALWDMVMFDCMNVNAQLNVYNYEIYC